MIKKIVFTALGLIITMYSLWLSEPIEVFVDDRDNNSYEIVELNELKWFKENLRYRFNKDQDTLIDQSDCGVFYSATIAKNACPKGWRLPTEKEVKKLIKANKRDNLNLIDTLNISLCGRIDYGKHTKIGLQNTFWLNEDIQDGSVTHWHVFQSETKTHNHNVIVAKRKFPIRCVCEMND